MFIIYIWLEVLLPVDEVKVAFIHFFEFFVKVVEELPGLAFFVVKVCYDPKKDVVKNEVALNQCSPSN